MSHETPDRDTAGVIALAEACERHDGVNPLSEGFRLALLDGRGDLQWHEDPDTGIVAAAVGLREGNEPASVELFVHPEHRRRGHGSGLVFGETRLLDPQHGGVDEHGRATFAIDPTDDTRYWAHGDLPAQQAFAESQGLVVVRELHRMARGIPPLGSAGAEEAFTPTLPEGYAARSLERGRDEAAWLEVNARAFASHPEQGRITMADLEARMAEPWFRAEDLLLVHELTPSGEEGRLAAFHWTKIDPPGGTSGEVYVVGVDPSQQGRGLGRVATQLGLAHLRERGCTEVDLYVDGDNAAARRTYDRLGFEIVATDRQFARPRG